MDFITAKEAAEKWGITIRWVQQCCKNGLIPGAGRLGNRWIIPKDAIRPSPYQEVLLQTSHCMPLLNRTFQPGMAVETIESIGDPNERNLAWGEYYYFSGQTEKAAEIVRPYLQAENILFQLSAGIIYGYSNLALLKIDEARKGLGVVQAASQRLNSPEMDQKLRALGIYIQVMASVLLHLPVPEGLHLEHELRHLPKGAKMYACYVMAHQHYLRGSYWESVGVAELALSIADLTFPIASIYLHLVAAMSLMRLKRSEEAREHYMAAWEIAREDNLIQAFGEHHGLLCGLVETCMKRDYPEEYQRIINITYRYSEGWRRIHNTDTNNTVTGSLSTAEFSIAMLASRGWSNQEIASFMSLSVHTVKNYISIIFQKLGITRRSELEQYMLK